MVGDVLFTRNGKTVTAQHLDGSEEQFSLDSPELPAAVRKRFKK